MLGMAFFGNKVEPFLANFLLKNSNTMKKGRTPIILKELLYVYCIVKYLTVLLIKSPIQ